MVFLTLGADPFACVLAPAMFMLSSKAYPCIIDVTVALTDLVFPVSKTFSYFSIGLRHLMAF